MALESGSKLGPYEVLGPLGSGGMGEVYRARDPKLSREVAIKVLPSEVARDRERLSRFRREATLLAALNHPNIAAIHGLEESGAARALESLAVTRGAAGRVGAHPSAESNRGRGAPPHRERAPRAAGGASDGGARQALGPTVAAGLPRADAVRRWSRRSAWRVGKR